MKASGLNHSVLLGWATRTGTPGLKLGRVAIPWLEAPVISKGRPDSNVMITLYWKPPTTRSIHPPPDRKRWPCPKGRS